MGIFLIFICSVCYDYIQYKRNLVRNLYVIKDDSQPARRLVQMDKDGGSLHLVREVIEIRGNDSVMLIIDTANYRNTFNLLRLKNETLYPEDLEELTSTQYDFLVKTLKINYSYSQP